MLAFTLTPLAGLPVRIPLGLAMVLFLPGYTFIAALFPRRADLEGLERAALSFGLSIAIVPLLGLGLNYTPWGIRLTPVVLSLAVFTVAMAAIAYLRRMDVAREERFSIEFIKSRSAMFFANPPNSRNWSSCSIKRATSPRPIEICISG